MYYMIQACGSYINKLRRPPTPNEIFIQAWLGMCYGARGICYYNVYTEVPDSSAVTTLKDLYGSVWGLFSEDGVEDFGYGDVISTSLTKLYHDCQDTLYPNTRFYAVKDLNSQIDSVSQTLLNLKWQLGFSLNQTASYNPDGNYSTETYLSSIKTYDSGNSQYVDAEFVELGIFQERTLTGSNVEHFMVVNRLLETTDTQNLRIYLNKSGSSYNNWLVTDIATGRHWSISKTGYFDVAILPGRGKLFRLEPVAHAGKGTFVTSETVTCTVYVAWADTLSIEPGVNLTFQSGARLEVSGTLDFQIDSGTMPVLDFSSPGSNNGIFCSGSAEINLKNVEIKNAVKGVYLMFSTADIQNCYIHDCTTGIYHYGNISYEDNVIIKNDSIFNNSKGIWLEHCTEPLIQYNSIVNNFYGIYVSIYSSPIFGGCSNKAYNLFDNNSINIFATDNSDFVLGANDCRDYGYNAFADYAIIHAQVEEYCDIIAENNWWGGIPSTNDFSVDRTSTLDYSPYLSSNPIPNGKLVNPALTTHKTKIADESGKSNMQPGQIPEIPEGTGNSLASLIRTAKELFNAGNINGAEGILKGILQQHQDSLKAFTALHLMQRTAVEYDRIPELYSFLSNLKSNSPKKPLLASAGNILAELEDGKKLQKLDALISEYNNDEYVKLLLYNKFLHLLIEKNNFSGANSVADELLLRFPESQASLNAQMHLNGYKKALSKPGAETSENNLLPEKYELLGNYPNPFNPSTTFRFALPFESDVRITIYDIMGAEITSLTLEGKPAGYHNVLWNGRNSNGAKVSSGIYLYRFEAESLENNQKYIENAKMMMLK
jgi:parallel beta-helix repeat protein